MDDQHHQQQQQQSAGVISQLNSPTVGPSAVGSPHSVTTGANSLSSSTSSLTLSTGALVATIKGSEQTKNWKFKPQTPTDILSNGYRRRRRNSAPAPSVEAFVTHWKYDTKGGSMVDLKNNPRTPSKLQHNFTKPSSPEPPQSPLSPRSPPQQVQGSGGAVYSNSRAAVRKSPYDRRRSLPFIHDPNTVSPNPPQCSIHVEHPSLAPLSLMTPSMASSTATPKQTASTIYSIPPPFVSHQPHPAFVPSQLPHQLSIQEQQILLNQQLPHQVQYPLQPLPIKVDSVTTSLPPLSSLLHSLKINDESLKNAPFQHTESAFQPTTKASLTSSNDTNHTQLRSDEVSSSQMLIGNLISEPNAENRKMAISNLVQ